MDFRVVIEQGEDGLFVACCPTLPGCWSQGHTLEQAKRNIAEAISAYLEDMEMHGDPIPPTHVN